MGFPRKENSHRLTLYANFYHQSTLIESDNLPIISVPHCILQSPL